MIGVLHNSRNTEIGEFNLEAAPSITYMAVNAKGLNISTVVNTVLKHNC